MWHNVQFRGAGMMRPVLPAEAAESGSAQAGPAPAQPPSPPAIQPDPARLIEGLGSLQQARSATELLQQLGRLLSAEASVTGAWLAVQTGQAGQPQRGWQFVPLIDAQDNPLWQLVSASVGKLVAQSIATRQQASTELNGKALLVACPATGNAQSDEALVLCFTSPVRSVHAGCVARLATATIQQWRSARMLELTAEQSHACQRLVGLGHALALATTAETAQITAVNQLQQLLGANQVWLARIDATGRATITAVSGLESFDAASPALRAAESAIQSCEGIGPVWLCPDSSRATPCEGEISPELANWLQANGAGSGVVVKDAKIGRTAVLAAFSAPAADAESATRRLGQAALFACGQLELVSNRFELPGSRLLRRTRDILRQNVVRGILIGLGAVAACLLVPFPARIGCDTRLEPVARRFVAAPFEATLERTLVRNGDTVKAGDVLAVLDGRTHRMEQSALEAELAAAGKKRDSSLAAGNVADAQMAKKDCQRIESRLELVRQQLNELEIRAPVDGVVVSGDLDTAEGVSLTLGQTLFEIGPLDRIRAEILVPETDIRHVRNEADVRVRLESWPFATWTGKVTRVHQRSEIIDEQNCFVAEVELDNPDGRLRPGMKGHAGIAAGWKPLGWSWMHRAWDRFRYLLVW
jgi:Barrel-sandwich domain of CusB or HlyD membrane-fusion